MSHFACVELIERLRKHFFDPNIRQASVEVGHDLVEGDRILPSALQFERCADEKLIARSGSNEAI